MHLHFVAQLPERGHQILDADAVTGRDEEDLAAVGAAAGPQLFQTLLVHQVDLVDHFDLATFGQFGVEAAQLLVDELETGPGIVVAHVLDAEDVHQEAGALHMLEEAVAQALAFVGALDEAGDVGDDHAAVRIVFVDHDAQIGRQRGEGISRDLGPRRRDLRDEGGLARIGQAQQAGVGQDLQFQAQLAFFAGLAGLGETRGAHGGRLEMLVAHAAATALGGHHFHVGLAQVGQQVLLAHLVTGIDQGAHGQAQDEVIALAAVALAAHAGLAVAGLVLALEAEVIKGKQAAVRLEDDGTALAGPDLDSSFVHKTHEKSPGCHHPDLRDALRAYRRPQGPEKSKKGKKPCGLFPSKITPCRAVIRQRGLPHARG